MYQKCWFPLLMMHYKEIKGNVSEVLVSFINVTLQKN